MILACYYGARMFTDGRLVRAPLSANTLNTSALMVSTPATRFLFISTR
jgi:hypothetical protein